MDGAHSSPPISLGAPRCSPSKYQTTKDVIDSGRQFASSTGSLPKTSGGQELPSTGRALSPVGGSTPPPAGRSAPARQMYTQEMKEEEVEAARREAAASKKDRLEALSARLVQNTARHLPEAQRSSATRKAIDEIVQCYPTLKDPLLHISRYIKETESTLQTVYVRQAEDLSQKEKEMYDKFESFFEGKFLEVLREKKRSDDMVQTLREEILQLRKGRDVDLTEAKEDLVRRLNECEQREEEFRTFRQLIAAVFKTNQELTDRVDLLEENLKKHRLPVPPASQDLYVYSKKGNQTEVVDEDDIKHITSQVPVEFVAASKEEMALSRLTLQRELLQSAFDDRTAYRMQVNGLKSENAQLQFKVTNLQNTIIDLNRYIHDKRFLSSDECDESTGPRTPRPRDVPFSIQTELGIDLRSSTSDIVAQLAAAATNMKHQLNSALLRLRQASTVAEWMEEETMLELDEEYNYTGILPTYPAHLWPTIPHFLRTLITTDIPNNKWSASDTGAILLDFFKKYNFLREESRFMRDGKMVAPRTYQQYEYRERSLVRLDATKEDVENSVKWVPFGYVVSHFIHKYFVTLDASVDASKRSSDIVLPGTLQPCFKVRNESHTVEIEFTRFAYNLWWAAQQHRNTQPLCDFFLRIVDGRLPVELFDVMSNVVARVTSQVRAWDAGGGNRLSYSQLVSGTLRLVNDMDDQAGRCGVLAVVQTFEENATPITGGRLKLDSLLADESRVPPKADPKDTFSSERKAAASNAPPPLTARRAATEKPLSGASVFIRYWRKLVLRRYECIYAGIERILSPFVRESEVVLGLYLLSVPKSLAALQKYDSDAKTRTDELKRASEVLLPAFPEELPITEEGLRSDTQVGGSKYSIPDVTKNYMTLLNERRDVLHAKRAREEALLFNITQNVLSKLPRLSQSVHFPFDNDKKKEGDAQPDDTEEAPKEEEKQEPAKPSTLPPAKTTGNAAKGKPGTKGGATSSSKAAAKPKKKKAAPKPAGNDKSPVPPVSQETVAETNPDNEEIISEQLLINPDKELVEWYTFCHNLRNLVLPEGVVLNKQTLVPSDDGADPVLKRNGEPES
ncbi:hypothetical protein, conserved [Angomonas deanei]|uniref:Uncharacterized protein n=1 Tax=Angomonas deanei TaxID=59799 RepID=A0A7G2CF09_9TRYP|nr:hypothetical protein, conserved [Angomonas deanei]